MRTLSLLLLSGSGVTSSGGTGTTSSSASSGGSTATGADVQEQVLDILALESLSNVSETCNPGTRSIAAAHLGEQGCPDGLNLLDLCGLDQGLELVGLRRLAIALSLFASCAFRDGAGRTVMSTPSSARMRAA